MRNVGHFKSNFKWKLTIIYHIISYINNLPSLSFILKNMTFCNPGNFFMLNESHSITKSEIFTMHAEHNNTGIKNYAIYNMCSKLFT